MLTILGAIVGLLGSMLPEAIKWLNRREDNAHELNMLRVQAEIAAKEHAYRLEEIGARADIAEAQVLRQPQQSFGVRLLDAATSYDMHPVFLVPVFWLFSFTDFFIRMVRPVITYALVVFYAATKYARYEVMSDLVTPDTPMSRVFMNLWGEQDYAMLSLVLSYWFGNRIAKHAFGWTSKT